MKYPYYPGRNKMGRKRKNDNSGVGFLAVPAPSIAVQIFRKSPNNIVKVLFTTEAEIEKSVLPPFPVE